VPFRAFPKAAVLTAWHADGHDTGGSGQDLIWGRAGDGVIGLRASPRRPLPFNDGRKMVRGAACWPTAREERATCRTAPALEGLA
jgi:hypothetical protein